MKILHIVEDQTAALVAARVVHTIAQNGTPAWRPTCASALEWLQENRDAAAVIAEVHAQSCAAFIRQLRTLGLTTPVVVVGKSPRLEPALAALTSGADGYIAGGPTLEAALPRAVTAAIDNQRRRRQLVTETLTELEAEHNRTDHQRARLDEARGEAERRSAYELAATAVAQLGEVESRYSVSLARQTKICMALQQRLFEVESALRKADEQQALQAASSADQLARRHSEFMASLAQAAHTRDVIAAELSATTAALEEALQGRRADAAAAAEHLQRREAELRAAVADAAAARTSLENALADAETAHEDTRQRAASDLAAANERQAALEDLLTQETDRRTTLERRLALAEAALQDGDRRHASELTTTATAVADLHQRAAEDGAAAAMRQAALEDRFGREVARGMRLEQQLCAAETARMDAERRHQSDLNAAETRAVSLQAQYDAAVTEHTADRVTFERRLTDALSAHQQAEHRAAAAITDASSREAALVERLTAEIQARTAVERNLAAERVRSARGRHRSVHVVSIYRRQTREEKARLERQLTSERIDADRALRATQDELRVLQQEHQAVRGHLATTQDQLRHLHTVVDDERQAHELARLASESELQRVSGEYGQIRHSFDRLQSAFQALEQIAGEHAAERRRLEAVVTDRDSQLSAQAERHRAADQHAQDALAQVQERLRQALETGGQEIARLRQEIDGLRRELAASRTHADALRGVAERVPGLQTQLERSQNETRRQFERAPYALCRCSPSGTIVDANHAFVALLGYRRVDDVRNKDFLQASHDVAGDLGWLLARARTTRKTETVETQWKGRDDRRLVIRLQALSTATVEIEIVAEDVTPVRALEDRLRQAQRMEAVGRLAAEVAVTCEALLGDVARGAHEWLDTARSDHALRQHVERLLTDVTRAGSFLRQLVTYGNEQVRALEPVSAQRVLQDLAPVMKRVVGDQIELVLPRSAGPFNVDVDAERLERVLINVAGYARQRMPSGGQVRIDLATTAVGRRFAARYANVRPGDHVLITVTELPAAGQLRGDGERRLRASDAPGVDLGVLVDLIASCGGHLWLEAQPAGNMVVKIHLPKAAVPQPAENRGGRLSRLFRSGSPSRVRA